MTLLTDTRPCAAAAFQHRLTGWRRGLYHFCDKGRSLKNLLASANDWSKGEAIEEGEIRQQLDQWLSDRLIALLDDRYLSLALRAESE